MASDVVFENSDAEKPQTNAKKPRNNFLDHFSKLTSHQQKIRLKSGSQIIRHLQKNAENDDEYNYAVGRLVRGLGASKINARIGFYSTLNVLLQTSEKFEVNSIFEVIEKELKTSGQNSKSENADVYTGLILVCGALLHTGKFTELDDDKKKSVLQYLVDASTKKSYLGLLGASMIVDTLSKTEKEVFAKHIIPVLRPQFKKPLKDYTIDQLYLLLKCEEHFPGVINAKFLSNIIESEKIISEHNLKAISQILLDISPGKCIGQHPIYPYIATNFVSTSFLPKILQKLDENFANFSHAKHQVLCVVLKHIVENLKDPTHINFVFGNNLLVDTIRHFKTTPVRQQDEIKVATVGLLNATAEWSKKDEISSGIKVKLIERLLFYPGTFIFEKITGTKVLQSVTATLDVAGVEKLCEIYRKVVLGEFIKKKNDKETETWLNLDRVYAAQLIVKLIQHPAMRGEQDFKISQLRLLLEVGLMKREGIGADLSAKLKETFFSALDFKFRKLQDVIAVLPAVVRTLNEQRGNLRGELPKDGWALWEKSVKLLEKIEKKSKENHLTMVFHVLFLQMSLQLLNDEKLASDSLKELFSCYQRRKSGKSSGESGKGGKSSGKGKREEIGANCEVSEEDEIEWIEVVIDLFLNLLSHNSHLLRSVISRVFPHLCKYLTASALQQVLHVLDPKSENNPLSHFSDDSDDSDDAENSENDDNSDENTENFKEIENENSEENAENSEEDDENNSEDNFENSDEEETQNDKLRQALHQVLLKNRPQNGHLDNDEDSDVDMDEMSENEGKELNQQLAEAFKQFRPQLNQNNKKKQSKDDETLTHFRVRVMDLIDIYLESSEVSLVNGLEIMLPLLQSLEFSIRNPHQKPLQNRVKSSLKKLSLIKTFENTDEVTEDILCTLLRSILDKGTKSALMVQEMGDKIADCCMFIVNASSIVGCSKGVSSILVEVLESYFQKRDSLTPYVLFKNILSSTWEKSVVLISSLMNYVFEESIRPFRRRQALELLSIFYLNNRLIAANKEIFAKKLQKAESKLWNNIQEFLESKEYRSKEPFVARLFLLLAAVKNCCISSAVFDWDVVTSLVKEYRSGIALSNDGKAAFSKLCTSLKVSNVVKMKAQTVKLSLLNRLPENKDEGEEEDDDDDDEESKQEKNRKRRSKEAKRLKKEARNLRMQSLSEGMTKVDFATADIDNINENDVDDDKNNVDNESDEDVEVKRTPKLKKEKTLKVTKENGVNKGEKSHCAESSNKTKKVKENGVQKKRNISESNEESSKKMKKKKQ